MSAVWVAAAVLTAVGVLVPRGCAFAPVVTRIGAARASSRPSSGLRRRGSHSSSQQLGAFEEVVDRYDAFLLDQFGVVHDGQTCYPGSAALVRRLQESGKRVVVLSNSSKRRRATIERLQGLRCGMCTNLDAADVVSGVPAIAVFTSGDLVHDALQAMASPQEPSLFEGVLGRGANKAFVFCNGDDDVEYLKTADVIPAPIEEADYILARGLFCTLDNENGEPRLLEPPPPFVEGGDDAMPAWDAILRVAAERRLPMIVANPDLVRPDGKASPMPGRLAKRYEDHFGGSTFPVGKPHKDIYDAAIRRALAGYDLGRVLAVGDSMDHDIAGAHDAGIDSLLVASGVHALDLGLTQGTSTEALDKATLDAFLAGFSKQPTFVVPGFALSGTLAPPEC